MSKFFIFCLSLISLNALAQPQMQSSMPRSASVTMNFKEQKAKILENLNFGMAHMAKHKECITAANDETALKNCMDKSRKEAEEHMKKMNPEAYKRMQASPGPGKSTK